MLKNLLLLPFTLAFTLVQLIFRVLMLPLTLLGVVQLSKELKKRDFERAEAEKLNVPAIWATESSTPEAQRELIDGFRSALSAHENAKLNDQKILAIVKMVRSAFRKAAAQKDFSCIPEVYIVTICLKFMKVYVLSGEDFMQKHLQYEIDLYMKSGLRDDYAINLELFEVEDGNYPI
jgi:hypothetical protein